MDGWKRKKKIACRVVSVNVAVLNIRGADREGTGKWGLEG